MCIFVIMSKHAVYACRHFTLTFALTSGMWEFYLFFRLVMTHEYKDNHLFSISAPQHIAAHDVDEVGLWVQLTHQLAEPPPEPGHKGLKHII